MRDVSKTMGGVIIGALSGAAIAAVITGYWTQKVEREKFTYSAVLRALEPEDLNKRSERLRFIIDIGLVEDATLRKNLESKLKKALEKPSELPQFQTDGLAKTDVFSWFDGVRQRRSDDSAASKSDTATWPGLVCGESLG